MNHRRPPFRFALRYHWALPPRIRGHLHGRGLPDTTLETHLLGWSGRWITIPIFDQYGDLAFFRLAKDPHDSRPGPKMLSPKGASAELYGWERLRQKPRQIVFCEGEFDRLVLEARGFPAVTVTGGAGTFKKEWIEAFQRIPEVNICFDGDEAGRKGAKRVAGFLPQARIVQLPESLGPGGDVTDFFVRLGRSRQEFTRFLREARPLPDRASQGTPGKGGGSGRDPEIARLKAAVPLESLVACHLTLRKRGAQFLALCPFHKDRDPSLVVFPDTQTFHCFGCGAHGDGISFLRRHKTLSFVEALEELRRLAPSP